MTEASPTIKVRAGNTRVTGKEQYYTPPALAHQLTQHLATLVDSIGDQNFASRTILEPAGGTGAFIHAAQAFGANEFLSFDIEPKHPMVTEANFLEQRLGAVKGAVTLGNPPFGRNNALSIPFFNHAAAHSDFIAFIVPRSWRKWSVVNRLDRNFHLIDDRDISIDYVDEQGLQISTKLRLNTCFQVWQRQPQPRPHISVTDHGLVAKSTPQIADVALTVFGYGCGQVTTDFPRRPNTTKMFLKLGHPGALAALRSVDFGKFYRNTAYTEALSLQEINYLLNEAILGNPHLIEKV